MIPLKYKPYILKVQAVNRTEAFSFQQSVVNKEYAINRTITSILAIFLK